MSDANPIVVLCIDDDPKALLARRLVLATAGYDVLTASSGDDALRILGRRKVNLVIADAFLPHVSAAEITTAIKQHSSKTAVVLLSGAPELPLGAEQADLVLVKGMAPADFLAEIGKLVAARFPERSNAHEHA